MNIDIKIDYWFVIELATIKLLIFYFVRILHKSEQLIKTNIINELFVTTGFFYLL